MIITLAARNSWNVYEKKVVFVEQPQGYEKKKLRIQGIQVEEDIIWP